MLWHCLDQLGHGNCISVNNPCVIKKHCIQLVAILLLNQYHLVGCILDVLFPKDQCTHGDGTIMGYLPSDDCIKNYPTIYQTNICWWIPTQVQVSQESNDASYHVCFSCI